MIASFAEVCSGVIISCIIGGVNRCFHLAALPRPPDTPNRVRRPRNWGGTAEYGELKLRAFTADKPDGRSSDGAYYTTEWAVGECRQWVN